MAIYHPISLRQDDAEPEQTGKARALELAGRQGQQTRSLAPGENWPGTSAMAEGGGAGAGSMSRSNCLPLIPNQESSLECLLSRLHPIHDLLLRRGFSDAVASRAVDEMLKVGREAISSGKAARMSKEHRAGWLWKVALNAARRAATTEPSFVSLNADPVDRHSCSGDDRSEALLETMRREIDKLAPKQKQAIELHGLQGRSLREAARLIDVRPATVAYRYNVGLTRLASAMKAMIEPGHN